MANIYKDLGKKIRKYRKEKNYSTATFAEMLEVSAGLINYIENGKYDVFKLDLLNRISNILNIPLNRLLPFADLDPQRINFINEKISLITDRDPSIEENINLIDYNLNLILNSFLNTISEYSYSKEGIEILSNHILEEFNLLTQLHQLNDKVPTA